MAAEAKVKEDVEEENAVAQMVKDGWSDWKRMFNKCEWKFDDKSPETMLDVDDELKAIIQVMKDKKIKPTRVRTGKNLMEALKAIGCYADKKEYIDKHLTVIVEQK